MKVIIIHYQIINKLKKYDDREILEIILAKFKYLYEKIIKKLNIPSETLLIPLNNINNLDHIIKMISIYHNIKYDYAISSLGLIYTYIDFNNINFHNVKVKFSLNN